MDDQLLDQAKRRAAETGRTLTAFIEDSVRESLARRESARSRKAIKLRTVGGRGLRSGLDLDDSAGLRDFMDLHDAAR
jgi:hypothetical protein